MTFNPAPNIGTDGQTAAANGALVSGKTSLGVQHDLLVDSSGKLEVNASVSVSGSDGAIQDGSDTSIKATVLDYTNSNPLAVRLTDTNGDYIAAGAGTQYTEDSASASDPIGTMLIGRRRDTLSTSEVSADGDNIALNATNKGQLHVKIADTVTVDGSGVTQPVSAASLPLPTGAATSAKQDTGNTSLSSIDGKITAVDTGNVTIGAAIPAGTNLIGKVKLTDGTDDATVRDVTGAKALDVAIVDGSGDQITSFGGGTQYTEGDTDTTITGTAMMFETDTGTSALGVVSASNPLPISDNGGSITVDGTFWQSTQPVSASSLPLPTGASTSAKQDTGNTSLSSIDGKMVTAQTADYDTGAGTVTTEMVGIALPASGGPVAGGTSTNPVRTDPTGTTAQPVTDNGGSLTVDNAGTFAVQESGSALTSLQLIDNPVATISSTDVMRVAIFDDSDSQITSFGGGTQYTEDAAAAANPVGNMLIARRKDTLSTSEVSADGDNIALNSTNKGQLHVKIADTVTVDGSGVTQPISAASLPLPSGAATSAKQPALGTAGSASSDVITVQGIASMTALKTDGSGVTQPVSGTVTANIGTSGSLALDASVTGLQVAQGSTTSGQSGTLVQGATTTSAPTYTTAKTNPLSLDTSGNLRVTLGTKLDSTNDSISAVQSGTWTVQPGNTANTTAWKVDASSVAVPVTDNSGSLTVDAPLATPVFATLTPNTTGGWSVNSQTGLTNTKVAVKSSAGTFGGYYLYNPNSSATYIQVFNVASGSVTLGTTTPTYVLTIPATAGANLEIANGINHSTAITLAATTTATGSTAPSTALTGFFLYK